MMNYGTSTKLTDSYMMEALFCQNARARGETIGNDFVKKLQKNIAFDTLYVFVCIKNNPFAPILPYGNIKYIGKNVRKNA